MDLFTPEEQEILFSKLIKKHKKIKTHLEFLFFSLLIYPKYIQS